MNKKKPKRTDRTYVKKHCKILFGCLLEQKLASAEQLASIKKGKKKRGKKTQNQSQSQNQHQNQNQNQNQNQSQNPLAITKPNTSPKSNFDKK
jgi:hypothetical protein